MSRTRVTSCGFRAAAVVVLTTTLLSGCLSESSCSSARRLPEGLRDLAIGTGLWAGAASASCAAGIEYRDRFYVAWYDRLPVAKGEPLGEAVYPPCDDGNGCGDEPDATGRPIQVWAPINQSRANVATARTAPECGRAKAIDLTEASVRFLLGSTRNGSPRTTPEGTMGSKLNATPRVDFSLESRVAARWPLGLVVRTHHHASLRLLCTS